MSTEVGTYSVEDAFHINGRGWILTGTMLTGQAHVGNHLAFSSGLMLNIKGIEFLNVRNHSEKISLLILNQFASRQEFIDQQIIGATARVLE